MGLSDASCFELLLFIDSNSNGYISKRELVHAFSKLHHPDFAKDPKGWVRMALEELADLENRYNTMQDPFTVDRSFVPLSYEQFCTNMVELGGLQYSKEQCMALAQHFDWDRKGEVTYENAFVALKEVKTVDSGACAVCCLCVLSRARVLFAHNRCCRPGFWCGRGLCERQVRTSRDRRDASRSTTRDEPQCRYAFI